MKKTLFSFVVLATLFLSACGNSDSSASKGSDALEPVPADYAGKTNPLGADAATAGAHLFKVNCESCHGAQGHGDGPAGQVLDPKPKNLPDLAAQVGDDYLFWRVSTGKPGTSMPPWAGVLSDEQVWQVVAFIRTLK